MKKTALFLTYFVNIWALLWAVFIGGTLSGWAMHCNVHPGDSVASGEPGESGRSGESGESGNSGESGESGKSD